MASLPGGGSLEGTGYGVAHMRLFTLYRLWRDATGEDLAAANPHLSESIDYWIHATVPTAMRMRRSATSRARRSRCCTTTTAS